MLNICASVTRLAGMVWFTSGYGIVGIAGKVPAVFAQRDRKLCLCMADRFGRAVKLTIRELKKRE
jgi:hypothetical protein